MRTLPPAIERKLMSKIQAGPTALLSNLWISRPTVPLTEDRYLERQSVLSSGVSRASVTVSHPTAGQGARRIYIGYLEDGIAKVKSAEYRVNMATHTWRQESFAEEAEDISVCYDGSFQGFADGTAQFITKNPPWVFWVQNGQLKGKLLGVLGDVTLAVSGCTRVAAVRPVTSGETYNDFGLIVFFLLSGSLYYRQLINNEWKDAELVSFGPAGVSWVELSAYKTWDYRVGVQALGSDGKVYELFTQYQGFGRHGSEHLEVANVSTTGNLTEIEYRDAATKEHVAVASVAVVPALYGGLYKSGAPQIVSVYNIANDYEDWGKTVVVRFDRHLVAADVAAQPGTFSIVDSRNTPFIATSAALQNDGLTVVLGFVDFNNAKDECDLIYTPGTVASMAGTALTALSFEWTPQNLVPSTVPAPEVYSISNTGYSGAGLKRVRFYNTPGTTLLHTEYVQSGGDAEYGTDDVWAATANTGTAVSGITENITADVDVYMARWTVRYFNKTGTAVNYTEYVVDGEDAVWGYGRDWAATAGGNPSAGILEDISGNIDVYSCVSYIEVDYIESTGTQWVDTLVAASSSILLELDYAMDSYRNDAVLFGSNGPVSYHCTVYSSKYFYGTNGTERNGGSWVSGRHVIRYNDENNLFTLDGSTIGGPYTFDNGNNTIKLLYRGSATPASIKFYGMKLINKTTDSIIHDYHPALDPLGVACLFDEITNEYVYNSGSGSFSPPTYDVKYYTLDGLTLLHTESVAYGSDANWSYGDGTWALTVDGETDVAAQQNITADRNLYYTGTTPKFFEFYLADWSGYTTNVTGTFNNTYLVAYFDDNMASTYTLNGTSASYSVIAVGQQQTLATTVPVVNPGTGGSNFIAQHYDSGSYISVVGGWVNAPAGGAIYEQAANGTTNTITMSAAHRTLFVFVGGCASNGGQTVVINGKTYTITNIGNHYGRVGMYGAIVINNNADTSVSVTWPVSCTNYLSIIGLD